MRTSFSLPFLTRAGPADRADVPNAHNDFLGVGGAKCRPEAGSRKDSRFRKSNSADNLALYCKVCFVEKDGYR
jgi:hypothetical protein